MEQTFGHNLILVIVNQGFAAEVMESAKSAGATGGTVIHATGSGMEHFETFFGLTLKPEKELILILTPQHLKKGIMSAVVDVHGPGTDADAFLFSLPVDKVLGLTAQKSEVKKQ